MPTTNQIRVITIYYHVTDQPTRVKTGQNHVTDQLTTC